MGYSSAAVGVGDSVGDSVGESVGDSVGESVGSSVGESVGDRVRVGLLVVRLAVAVRVGLRVGLELSPLSRKHPLSEMALPNTAKARRRFMLSTCDCSGKNIAGNATNSRRAHSSLAPNCGCILQNSTIYHCTNI